MMRNLLCITAVALLAWGCQTVKPYQMQYQRDYYMQANPLPTEKLESEADTYREGASGGMGSKTGGGCGCN